MNATISWTSWLLTRTSGGNNATNGARWYFCMGKDRNRSEARTKCVPELAKGGCNYSGFHQSLTTFLSVRPYPVQSTKCRAVYPLGAELNKYTQYIKRTFGLRTLAKRCVHCSISSQCWTRTNRMYARKGTLSKAKRRACENGIAWLYL